MLRRRVDKGIQRHGLQEKLREHTYLPELGHAAADLLDRRLLHAQPSAIPGAAVAVVPLAGLLEQIAAMDPDVLGLEGREQEVHGFYDLAGFRVFARCRAGVVKCSETGGTVMGFIDDVEDSMINP